MRRTNHIFLCECGCDSGVPISTMRCHGKLKRFGVYWGGDRPESAPILSGAGGFVFPAQPHTLRAL
jgi:hypothetical protein